MHNQLVRQLHNAGLDADTPPPNAETWKAFLALIDRDYLEAAKERMVLGRNFNASQRSEQHLESLAQQGHQQITAERDKLKAVLASLKDGLCVFSIQGRLLLFNPAARQYLGATLGEEDADSRVVLGRFKLHDQWRSGTYLEVDELLEMLKEGSSLQDSDALLCLDNDELLPVSCVLNPIITGNHVTGTVLVFQDVRERKQVEEDLIKAKVSAEKASSAKSEFMSSMSHELRTPMNAILGYADILLDDLEDAPDSYDEEFVEEVQISIQNIKQAGRTLLNLINEVLDLTRMESGKLEIDITKVNLVEVLQECAAGIAPEVSKAGLSLSSLAADAEPVYAFADRRRLKQAVGNLLSNAVKYNRPQGTVSLRLEQSNPERVRVLVQDTGIGISPEQRGQIFSPFERMSGRNLSVGTGVGLTVTRHLMEIMDGEVGVHSEVNVGSTFWIELPTGVTAREGRQANLPGRKYLMLYIEDSRTNVSLVTKVLRVRPDVALISAPTGEMGVELARAHRPDMILLDINLPGIDGFEVLKRLQAYPEIQDIPVLGLSADDSSEALAQAKAAGFFEYMIKPLNKNKFLQAINNVLLTSSKA